MSTRTPPLSWPNTFSRGHQAVVEHQLAGGRAAHAELVELLRGGEAGVALLDDERGDAARARGRVGLGVDDDHVGIGAVGDPHLAAGEGVAVAALVSTFWARNCMPTTSEPAPGSLIASAPTCSPDTSFGR